MTDAQETLPEAYSSNCRVRGLLDAESKINEVLKKARLSDRRHLLLLCDSDLASLSGMSHRDTQLLKDHVAEQLVEHQTKSALMMLNDTPLRQWRLSTSCPVIDAFLKGGFLSGVITEVSGESACGKTQLCLQLCLSVQQNQTRPGGAVYICTEDVFPSRRLQQLIKFFNIGNNNLKFGDNIFIEHVADFEGLDICVEQRLPAMLARGLVRVVIIDSVAALFCCHYAAAQTLERAQHLARFASVLHQLAAEHNIPVVCVNQVSATMETSGLGPSGLTPALGLTWANQVGCRVMMSRPRSQPEVKAVSGLGGGLPTYRDMSVVFAPHLPPGTLPVYIDDAGLHGVELC